MTWYLYVVECDDGSLYTGVTTDTQRRVHEHNHTAQGARYTRSRRPVDLVAVWSYPDRSTVCQAEAAFKALDRSDKIEWVARTDATEDSGDPKPVELNGS
jgi:putative endonuclease